MSFLVKRPTLPQTSTAAQANQIATFQGAVPMTLSYGRIPFQGAHWLTDAFNRHTHTGGGSAPNYQYASIAASFGVGPWRFVGKVRMGGQQIGDVNHVRTTEDYIDYTFNPSLASGEASWMRFYFGTETQTADAALIAATGQNHPACRGQAYAIFWNLDLGQGNTSIPQIEIEGGGDVPAVGAHPGGTTHPYGVNVASAIYTLFTSQLGGLGCDPSLLDATHWGNQALALETLGIARRTGGLTYLHAILSNFGDAASVISEWLTYVDGYLRFKNGQIQFGWFPHGPIDPATITTISEADLTAKPAGGGFPDWNAGLSDTVVTFLDYDRQYTQQGATYRAPANRKSQIAKTPQQVDRPGCHSADQASYLAAEASVSGAQADPSTTLTVLRSRAVNLDGSPLLPGDLFNFVYDPEALDIICRVIERIETDPAAPVQLGVIHERGVYPTPHVPTIDVRVLPTVTDPGEVGSGDVRLFCLPSGFGDARQVAAFINRANREIIGAVLSMSPSGSAPWETILDQRWFPAKSAVGGSGVNDSATTIRVTSSSVDFPRMQAQSTVAQTDDTLLLLVDDELLSVSTISVVSAGVYDLGVIRGRQGSTAAAHTASMVAWLFYRAEIAGAQHNEFYNVRVSGVYDATEATKHFKLALETVDEIGTAKPDDPGLSLQLPDVAATTINGFTILITSEAHTVACDSTGTVNSGQLGSGGTARTSVLVFDGVTALTAVTSGPVGGEFSVALGTLTATTATKESNDTVRCDTLTADTGTIEIVVSIAGLFTVSKVFTLTKVKSGTAGSTGSAGTRGSKHFYVATTGTTWSDTEADAGIVAAGLTKVLLDEVTLYNNTGHYSESRFWSGSAWLTIGQVIDGNLLVTGTVGAAALVTSQLVALLATLGGFQFTGGTMVATGSSGYGTVTINPASGTTYGSITFMNGSHLAASMTNNALGGSVQVFDPYGTQSAFMSGQDGIIQGNTFNATP